MPKQVYKRQLKELKALKKDGKQIATIGRTMINRRIAVLNKKLKNASRKKKFRR
jgi:hypothetical protein